MGRTVVNITSDASCAIVVSRKQYRREAKKKNRARPMGNEAGV